VRHEGPVRTVDDLELRTLTWVHWFNQTRLHSALGHVPPVEYEQARTCQIPPRSNRCRGNSPPPLNPGRFTPTPNSNTSTTLRSFRPDP